MAGSSLLWRIAALLAMVAVVAARSSSRSGASGAGALVAGGADAQETAAAFHAKLKSSLAQIAASAAASNRAAEQSSKRSRRVAMERCLSAMLRLNSSHARAVSELRDLRARLEATARSMPADEKAVHDLHAEAAAHDAEVANITAALAASTLARRDAAALFQARQAETRGLLQQLRALDTHATASSTRPSAAQVAAGEKGKAEGTPPPPPAPQPDTPEEQLAAALSLLQTGTTALRGRRMADAAAAGAAVASALAAREDAASEGGEAADGGAADGDGSNVGLPARTDAAADGEDAPLFRPTAGRMYNIRMVRAVMTVLEKTLRDALRAAAKEEADARSAFVRQRSQLQRLRSLYSAENERVEESVTRLRHALDRKRVLVQMDHARADFLEAQVAATGDALKSQKDACARKQARLMEEKARREEAGRSLAFQLQKLHAQLEAGLGG
eukprot:PLAT11017.1.p1 GENE.PLAT11017.1~~PLAT11017.1.p1  ORF type:complete len:459 (+),score=239.91 PLAT11017.1:40-1377(+)